MNIRTKTVKMTGKIVAHAANVGVHKAAVSSMKAAGYVVEAQSGWIIKKDSNGAVTKIKRVPKATHKLVLD